MALSLTHAFVSAKSDGADSTLVRPSAWNAEHSLVCATGVILGRVSSSTGVVEELTPAQVRTLAEVTQSGVIGGINTRVSNYTLVVADRGKVVEMNVASANTLTIPANADAAFPVGTQITILQYGTGQTTIAPAAGVTINALSGALKITAQYGAASLYKRATNEWVAFGTLTT